MLPLQSCALLYSNGSDGCTWWEGAIQSRLSEPRCREARQEPEDPLFFLPEVAHRLDNESSRRQRLRRCALRADADGVQLRVDKQRDAHAARRNDGAAVAEVQRLHKPAGAGALQSWVQGGRVLRAGEGGFGAWREPLWGVALLFGGRLVNVVCGREWF